jgi:hypothetical protein
MRYTYTRLNGATTQTTAIFILYAVVSTHATLCKGTKILQAVVDALAMYLGGPEDDPE